MPRGNVRKRRRQNKDRNNSSASSNKANGEKKTKMKQESRTKKPWVRGGCLWGSALVLTLALAGMALWTTSDDGDKTAMDVSRRNEEEMEVTDGPIVASNGLYKVLENMPHDKKAFTQGLSFSNGRLYEGTGLYGKSELRLVDPNTGEVMQSHSLEKRLFGEGIALYTDDEGEKIIQITWKEQTGFIYNATSFEVLKEFQYKTTTNEGWGITYNEAAKEFIVSDGSNYIHFWDRDTLQQKRKVPVVLVHKKEGNDTNVELLQQEMKHLNELELDKEGFILSNVWYRDFLLRIDPITGYVERKYDFAQLYLNRLRSADCFNGISVTDKEDEYYVTGKLWPHMYRIKMLW